MSGYKLTVKRVEHEAKPGLYADGHNLYLQVSPGGSKTWIFRYMIDGRPRKMGLGPTHTISLAEARKRAAAARLQVHDRQDPIEAKRATRTAAKIEAARAVTFRECAERYISAHSAGWKNEKHREQWPSSLNAYAYPVIGELPVSAVDTASVLNVLEPIWTKKFQTATRLRGRIASVLDAAKSAGLRSGDNPAAWAGHLANLLPKRPAALKTKHHDAVPVDEMPAFMSALRGRAGVSARALEFIALTGARTSEAIEATWAEVDMDAGVWAVPPERMKAGREHRVPLSGRAIAVLKELPREGGPYLFPGARVGRPLSNMAALEMIRGLRGHGATTHGLRSTFRDWAAERTAHPSDVIEMALAHTIKDKVEAAYRRGDLFEKRRALMDDWSAFCGGNDGEIFG